jgi:RimJ/RimL family protein N-acetyltransferase
MPSIPQPAEPLTDGHVRLRMAAERDIPEILIAYQDDPQLHVRLGEDRPPSGAQLGSRGERAAHELEAGERIQLTITEPDADDCRGQISAQHFDWNHMRAELGIWVAPQARGQGVARRALRLAAGWLFETCALERLALLTEPDNEPMLRAAEGAGFVREGVLRSYARERGDRLDSAILSLLPGDLTR